MVWFARYAELQTLSKNRAAQMAGPQPLVPTGYDLYLDVFFKLNSERQNKDGSVGSIPVMKIIEYAQWINITDIDSFTDIILRVDIAYINQVSEQLRKQMQQASKGS